MERLRASLAVLLSLALCAPSAPLLAQSSNPSPQSKPTAKALARAAYQAGQLRGDQRILHALNRFTFGPRPGDLEAVRAVGLDRWFEDQLHPESFDQTDLDARLAQFPAMQLSAQDLLYSVPSDAMIRQAADGKVPIPSDPTLQAIYENQISRYQLRKQDKQQKQATLAANNVPAPPSANPAADTIAGNHPAMAATMVPATTQPSEAQTELQPGMQAEAQNPIANSIKTNSIDQKAALPALTPNLPVQPAPPTVDQAQVKAVLALPANRRIDALAKLPQLEFDAFRKALKGPQRTALVAGLTPLQKEEVVALENPKRVVNEELPCQRLARDIYSNAQLQEVVTDFWLNHFNVYLHKNDETPYYLVSYERDVIRPRALGKFEDLLEATAHSPAMLLYLDNSSSMGPDSPAAEKEKEREARHPSATPKAREGLNENYARELMELHTLGVNGGYTQADVIQVARIFSGWTVDRPQRGGDFKFDPNRHEPGTKKVMGKKFKEDGELEGRALLHMLATSPATAHFISRKLAIRFVGDNPPQALVDRMAKTFLTSGGDIGAVLRTLYHSPELWETPDWRAKVKTPLEFVVSAARASNVDTTELQPLVNALQGMGMQVYGAIPPTGYNWQASTWVSTGALVNRMNFALQFSSNKLAGIPIKWATDDTVDADATPETEEQRLEGWLVAGGVSETTRAAVLQQFSEQNPNQPSEQVSAATPFTVIDESATVKPARSAKAATALEKQDQLLAGLLLGSPEFQRR